jgi:hypothetical protein
MHPALLVLLSPLLLAAADSSTVEAAWQLGRTDPPTGEPFVAWLTLSPGSAAPDSVTVRLADTPAMQVWFDSSDSPCATSGERTWTGTVGAARTLQVCARPANAQQARLVAWVTSGAARQARAVSSDLLTIRSRWPEPPGWVMTIVSAIAGFITGLLSSMFQHRADRKAKAREQEAEEKRKADEHRREVENKIVSALAPELTAARATLAGFVANESPDAVPPTVDVNAGLLFVPAEQGALAGVADEYLSRIHTIYECLRKYDAAVTDFTNDARPAAREITRAAARDIGRECLTLITAPLATLEKARETLTRVSTRWKKAQHDLGELPAEEPAPVAPPKKHSP